MRRGQVGTHSSSQFAQIHRQSMNLKQKREVILHTFCFPATELNNDQRRRIALRGVVRVFIFARGGRDHVFLVSPLSYVGCHHSSTILFSTLLHFHCSSTMLVSITNCQHSSIYPSTLSALPWLQIVSARGRRRSPGAGDRWLISGFDFKGREGEYCPGHIHHQSL